MSKHHKSKWCREEKRYAIYARDSFTCVYCGRNCTNDAGLLNLDHIVPACTFSADDMMKNHESNLVTACVSCNNKKGSQDIRDFVRCSIKRAKIIAHARNTPIDRTNGKILADKYKRNA